MERNVVSLELAERLNDGWTKPTLFMWSVFQHDITKSVVATTRSLGIEGETYRLPAPTAQELADALPKRNARGEAVFTHISFGKYENTDFLVEDYEGHEVRADTMADALAMLWLEVNK